ncbi:hypothetical protein [Sphingomicrobium clamense]|uniref:Nucleoside-diphosphate sugar epimerase n=1 Tax=Sphingomicrobium clamense TaxID=2851013 RepID=A0ABS6V4X2_9SPHN|nr:hypothetical protein [Sphingomicrobium sp. B8]MBW0144410.1 hypothetical protein [Sphingomicrobium sp. B8]
MPRAAIIGATGLIGSEFVKRWPESEPLLALGRKGSLPDHSDWRIKYGGMDEWPRLLEGEQVDVAIATIGTTWAKVGNWDRFEAIDRHAVTGFLRAAKEAGARHAIVVSSTMADADSRNQYLAIKGRMEADAKALGFARLDIVRPGLLRGQRGAERRWKERLGILVSPLVNALLHGRLHKYRAIDAAVVAAAMVRLALGEGDGTRVLHNRDLMELAENGTA